MELSNLRPAKGAVKSRKRIARGTGSGRGGTSTRGHKGDKARSGFKNKRNFEGGQMPLQMRLPKRGFNNFNRVSYVPLNLSRLQEIADKYKVSVIDLDFLVKEGIVNKGDLIKILAHGDVTAALTITAHGASEKATNAINAAGGTVNLVK